VNKLKQSYQQLSEQEQRLVLISAIVIVIGLFYWVIWAPLNQSLETDRKAVAAQQELLSWVRKNANRAIQLRGASRSTSSFSGSLPQAVNQTAGRLNIAISRMQPQGEELQVWVDQAPFNDVLNWLQALEKMGVSILDMDIADANIPGQVKIRRLKLAKS
jgi:general secretion pathway protein M